MDEIPGTYALPLAAAWAAGAAWAAAWAMWAAVGAPAAAAAGALAAALRVWAAAAAAARARRNPAFAGGAAASCAPRVVVVGAGFAGEAAVARLGGRCVVVDPRAAACFVPALPRALAGSREAVRRPLAQRLAAGAELLAARACGLRPPGGGAAGAVAVEGAAGGGEQQLPFDYVLLAVGMRAAAPPAALPRDSAVLLSDCERLAPLLPRAAAARCAAAASAGASAAAAAGARPSAVVVGGGSSGVEVAAELAAAGWRVTLVHAGRALLPGEPPWVVAHATRWLEQHAVALVLGARLLAADRAGAGFVLDSGARLDADCAVLCTGGRPNTEWLAPGLGEDAFDDELGDLRVTPELHLPGHPRVFVAGDAAHLDQRKLAQAAEATGAHAADNILRAIAGLPLRPYRPRAYPRLISLGPWECLFVWGNWGFAGPLPALLKVAVHWKWYLGVHVNVF